MSGTSAGLMRHQKVTSVHSETVKDYESQEDKSDSLEAKFQGTRVGSRLLHITELHPVIY